MISRGYSLIEIMVVLSIFALLMLVATQALLLSLRSANKSESIARVKENVELAVSVMERNIRNAKSVPSCSDLNPTTLDFLDTKGVATNYTCENTGSDGYIATNGSRITSSDISIIECAITCKVNIGAPPTVTISITAQDKGGTGIEGAKAQSTTTILLRQY